MKTIVALASVLVACTSGHERPDAGRGPLIGCSPPIGATATWTPQLQAAPHLVDGRFDVGEWAGATRLEGLYTDAYLDYRDGSLYVLNDWRANSTGIRPDCFNLFYLTVAQTRITLRVYGDGHVEVEGAPSAEGAYGFGPSPLVSAPHTIYEFRLVVPAGRVDICCLDPTMLSSCDELSAEPAVFSIDTSGNVPMVARLLDPTLVRLSPGGGCGSGQGICADGLICLDGQCVPPNVPDGGTQSFDGGPPN